MKLGIFLFFIHLFLFFCNFNHMHYWLGIFSSIHLWHCAPCCWSSVFCFLFCGVDCLCKECGCCHPLAPIFGWDDDIYGVVRIYHKCFALICHHISYCDCCLTLDAAWHSCASWHLQINCGVWLFFIMTVIYFYPYCFLWVCNIHFIHVMYSDYYSCIFVLGFLEYCHQDTHCFFSPCVESVFFSFFYILLLFVFLTMH